jgi:hypothetical protein
MAAHDAGLNIALAASLLIQESGGGENIYGHDPTIFVGAGQVTEANYQVYLAERRHSGNTLMQGVGPCQLTYWSLQDAADRLGGCWKPLCNMRVGFSHLAEAIRRSGLRAGVAAYNGSGPAAEAYAQEVIQRADELASRLHVQAP